MRRGDLVTVSLPGDYGKPRPAVIVQSDFFAEHPSITIAPLTSALTEAPFLRLRLLPSPDNGLTRPSDIMVDKLHTVRRDKIGPTFGTLSPEQLRTLTVAIALFLGIA